MKIQVRKETKNKNMQAVRSKDSEIELILRQSLWKKGLRYRIHVRSIYGTPDIVIKRVKLAIFIDSEFWHGYNWSVKIHELKANRDFWVRKIERNMERDKEVNKRLLAEGWTVLRYWGNDVKQNAEGIANEITELYLRLRP